MNSRLENLKHFADFYEFYAHAQKLRLILLFIGAVIAGVIEIVGLLLLYYLLKVLVTATTIHEHAFLAEIFRFVGADSNGERVNLLGIAIVIIFVAKNLYILGYYYFQHLTLRKWKNDLSLKLLEGYLRAPYIQLLSYNSSTLKRNINNIVSGALNGYVLSALNLIANFIVGILITSILLYKFLQVTLIVASVLVVATIIQNRVLRKVSKNLGEERDRLAADQDKEVYQGFVALKETKVGGKENHFVEAFKRINEQVVINESKLTFLSRLPPHLTEIVVIFAIVIICSQILNVYEQDTTEAISTLGILAAVSFRIAPIMNRIISAVQGMNTNTSSIRNMHRELRRLRVIRNSYRRIPDQPKVELKDGIKIESLSFAYPSTNEQILNGLDFEIKKGEYIGIVGKSGAGKTTFVDILLGLLPPSTGRILIDSIPVTEKNIRGWQKSIGYVPQDVNLSDDSVAANVAFGVKKAEINGERVAICLKQVNLFDKVQTLNDGIWSDIGERGKFFSGGEKQRLGIARALYCGADVLVLDEATSALDAMTEDLVTQTLDKIKRQKTIIVIAHRLSTLKNADRILLLEKGEVKGFSSFRELYQSLPLFREMVDLSDIRESFI